MLFSSIPFLYWFLPVVLFLYYIAPNRIRNYILIVSSLLFYGWGEPRYVIIMMIAAIQGYVFGRLIERFRGKRMASVCLYLSLAISLGMLFYFKYTDFFLENFNRVTGLSIPMLKVALPIGISFYTFQLIGYVVDVYWGTVKAQKHFSRLAVFVTMFPQLIAGPIVRYQDLEDKLGERTITIEQAASGIRRFLIGFSKKILLANVLGELCSVYRSSTEITVLFTWLYAVCYMLHVYFDFSGYSDMAIGLGRLLGFEFPENFRTPYLSKSITEFWRRWHMTLGSWFRDYVYIPLGGNRVGPMKWYRNIAIVWMLTGMWHGASWTFGAWGLFFAILLVAEKAGLKRYLDKMPIAAHGYVLFSVMISFIIFDAATLSSALKTIGALFGIGGYAWNSKLTMYYVKSYMVVVILGLAAAMPWWKARWEQFCVKAKTQSLFIVFETITYAFLLLAVTAYLVDGSFNPFLYFRF